MGILGSLLSLSPLLSLYTITAMEPWTSLAPASASPFRPPISFLSITSLSIASSSPISLRMPLPRNTHGAAPKPMSSAKSHKYGRGKNRCANKDLDLELEPLTPVDCVGTGIDVECRALSEEDGAVSEMKRMEARGSLEKAWDLAVLISPFFFWGTAMVAMKEVLPKAGPFFVAAFRLLPSGFLLVAFAAYRGKPSPSGYMAWLSIAVFGMIDAACFQGFLAEGLERTAAGLGSVIIDSQPLTVAVLAAILFGESIGIVGAIGLVLGVVGLLLLEVPSLSFRNDSSLWGSGEWWMLLAAQSMAIGTVMVRWVTKYSDPIMATGWHMIIGSLPLVIISFLNNDPAVSGNFMELTLNDVLALLYTSIFGSAISYGVYFYCATKGSLTKLSSLTFLTPMFASIFGYIYLDETFSPIQLVGACVTVVAIYLVNFKNILE